MDASNAGNVAQPYFKMFTAPSSPPKKRSRSKEELPEPLALMPQNAGFAVKTEPEALELADRDVIRMEAHLALMTGPGEARGRQLRVALGTGKGEEVVHVDAEDRPPGPHQRGRRTVKQEAFTAPRRVPGTPAADRALAEV